jgi:hypothetical protein
LIFKAFLFFIVNNEDQIIWARGTYGKEKQCLQGFDEEA